MAHWMDNFGAAYSVPAGTGLAAGDSLTLDFPYPAGAFHDSFVSDRAADAWTMRLDAAVCRWMEAVRGPSGDPPMIVLAEGAV